MWVWSLDNADELISFCLNKNIDRVFVTTDDMISVKKIQDKGIKVDYLYGIQWTKDEGQLKFLLDKISQGYDGLHLDIECKNWWNIFSYAKFMKNLIKQLSSKIYLNCDINQFESYFLGKIPCDVTLMAYRNDFKSIKNLVNKTVKNPNFKFTIGVETQDIQPASNSFYSLGNAVMSKTLHDLWCYFGKYRNFDDVAVHYYTSWKVLKN